MKGLERLIARDMACLTVLEGVASPQEVGALSGRADVDLTTCLTHEIERALDRVFTTKLATMSVKGAFYSVLRKRPTTTPSSSLLRDVGLPIAEVALEGIRLRLSTRLHKVDQQHPLVLRLPQQGRVQIRL